MRFKKILTILCLALLMTTMGFQNVSFAEELTDVSEETTDENEITADTSVIDEEVDDGITIEEVNDTDIEFLNDYEETDVENTDESDDVFDEEADLTQNNLLDYYKNNAVTLNYNTINGITLKKGEKRKVYKFTLTKDAIFSYNIKGYSDLKRDEIEFCILDEYKMEKDDSSGYMEATVREYYLFLSGDIKSYDESFYLRKGNYYLDISLSGTTFDGPVHLELETAVSYLNSTEKDNNDDFENAQEISNSGTYYGVAPINDCTDIYKFSTNNSRELHLSINIYGISKKNYGIVTLCYDDFSEQKRIVLDSEDTTHFDLTFEFRRAGGYYPGTYYIKFEGFSQGCYDFTVSMPTDGTISTSGIYCASNYPSIQAGINIQKSNESDMVEYRWVACNNNEPDKWFEISPWTKENNWMVWTPDKSGGYVFVCYARVVGNENASQIQATFGTEYHKAIKGICQMPYTGEGGGYLIGIESFDNPNHSYKYEMLILDCNLYVQGKDAWVYDTGKCGAPENCLWTIWQPQYGYYWTLFRIYDQNDNLIDEACYGFENVY